jgi:3',5'-cyclic AMP phosphodiesterase CpdA
MLAPLPVPVHVLPGNHDDPAAMRDHFPLDGDGPYAFTTRCGPLRLVACDTSRRGRDDGELDLDWLEAQLGGDEPTVVAMHHESFFRRNTTPKTEQWTAESTARMKRLWGAEDLSRWVPETL